MSAPYPDLKPHVPPSPPGSEACGCCDGFVIETPQGLYNRGGLSAIAYRVGDYAQFYASLHALLSSSACAPLSRELRTRNDDDFTIGLLDAFACAADVLTFYQERIANESYLRTAVERVSLQEMGRLIGYRLRPGVAAETWLAFALETPPAPPPNLAPEPGNFVTGVPARLTLDKGLKVQSVPGPSETPQTFETVEALAEARPAWNAMRPWLSETRRPGHNDNFTYLAGLATNLKPGDALVFLGDEFLNNTSANNWDFRVLDRVEPQPADNRTLVGWTRGLGSIQPFANPAQNPQVHVLRKRASIFGHNAPMWGSLPTSFRRNYPDGTTVLGAIVSEWPHFVLSPAGATASGGHVDLDIVYPDIHNGGYAVLAKGGFDYSNEPAPPNTYVELYEVTNLAEVSRAEFALSGKVTRARLVGANYSVFQTANGVRETSVFAASEKLEFADYPVETPVGLDRIPVAASADGLLPSRRLIVRGVRAGDGQEVIIPATLVGAHPVGQGRWELEITPPLADPLVRASVVVHANVALASHGESVSQILGAGNGSLAFQRFELKQLPLTYRAAANEIGAAAELTVRVGDVAWTERPTMYGAAPAEHAYTLITDEQGREFVVLGDGVRGARLPSGGNNIRAAYRKGIGVAGNVAPDKLTQLSTRPLGLKSVSNPLAASGGNDPEDKGAARETIPLTTRTLGRAVSLLDYEDFARAFSGIAKAQVRVLQVSAGPVVAITVAGPDSAVLGPANPVWINLLGALKTSGDPHVAVLLLAHQPSRFSLGLKVKRNPAYEIKKVLAAVEAALRDHFSFANRALGHPVQQSDVITVAQNVPGVVAVDLTRLYGGTQPAAQTVPSKQVRLLASRMRVQGDIALAAELLTLDPGPFDQLEEMA